MQGPQGQSEPTSMEHLPRAGHGGATRRPRASRQPAPRLGQQSPPIKEDGQKKQCRCRQVHGGTQGAQCSLSFPEGSRECHGASDIGLRFAQMKNGEFREEIPTQRLDSRGPAQKGAALQGPGCGWRGFWAAGAAANGRAEPGGDFSRQPGPNRGGVGTRRGFIQEPCSGRSQADTQRWARRRWGTRAMVLRLLSWRRETQ